MVGFQDFLGYLALGVIITVIAAFRLRSLWPVATASFFVSWPVDRILGTNETGSWIHMGSIAALAFLGLVAALIGHMGMATAAWGLTAPAALFPLVTVMPWQLTAVFIAVLLTGFMLVYSNWEKILEAAKQKTQSVKQVLSRGGSRP